MNELTIFDNEQFGKIRAMMIDDEPWFFGKDVANALEYERTSKAVMDHVDGEDMKVLRHKAYSELVPTLWAGDNDFSNKTMINESGVYSLIFSSKLKKAKQFKQWVTAEVLPTIRKTGGYVNNDDLFISMYFDEVDEASKEVLRKNLAALRKKNEIIAQQRKEIERKDKEIEHKENVIVGLVEDIDLATKRQRINQIIRFHAKTSESLFKKWNLLYSEFEKKYHVNLSIRLKNYKTEFKPQLKNKLDVIDRQMHMIPQLYEVCCKLFENDVKVLMQEWENAIIC